MFSSITNAISAAKGRAIEASARALINQKIESFGTVTCLEIDTRQKTLRAQVELKGEASGITVSAGRYELIEENGALYLMLADFQASREWLGPALNQFVAGRKIKVPDVARMAL